MAEFKHTVPSDIEEGDNTHITDTNKHFAVSRELQNLHTALEKAVDEIPAPGSGKDGASAYELAVEGGFEGTEAEWLTSLKGTDGDPGSTPEITFNGTKIVVDGTEGPNLKGAKGDPGKDAEPQFTTAEVAAIKELLGDDADSGSGDSGASA